jgi:hypothetical protein
VNHGSDFMTNIMNAVSFSKIYEVPKGDAISGFSPKTASEKYSLGMIPYTHKKLK